MYLTRESFKKRVIKINIPYWNEGWRYRWLYMKIVIQWMQEIRPRRILEAGSSKMPLNTVSYLFDLPQHDLNKIPYPFQDKFFDIAVALQVWEHLDKQAEAFREFARISKNIILSFPYRWDFGDNKHRGIDDKKILTWSCGIKPDRSTVIMQRNICLWNDKTLDNI
jgi:SAM-dependent methyltransferase